MDLLIFDVDGTLFQTELVTVPAVKDAFIAYGLNPPGTEQICSFFGKPVDEYEAWLARHCSADLVEELVSKANALELRYIEEYGALYPGTIEVLDALQSKGFHLAICSNGPDAYIEEFIRAYKMKRWFSAVCARGMRCTDKTAMTGWLLQQICPDRFAVIGDRGEDMKAAELHGGFSIAATYGYGTKVELQDADAHISSIREVPERVEALFKA